MKLVGIVSNSVYVNPEHVAVVQPDKDGVSGRVNVVMASGHVVLVDDLNPKQVAMCLGASITEV